MLWNWVLEWDLKVARQHSVNTFFEKHLVGKTILQFFTCTSAKWVMAIPQKNIKKKHWKIWISKCNFVETPRKFTRIYWKSKSYLFFISSTKMTTILLVNFSCSRLLKTGYNNTVKGNVVPGCQKYWTIYSVKNLKKAVIKCNNEHTEPYRWQHWAMLPPETLFHPVFDRQLIIFGCV